MQYVLTETEYNALVDAGDIAKAELKTQLQVLSTMVADHMPIAVEWKGEDPKPWGCVRTRGGHNFGGYCDDCPVRDQCPHDWKRWSQ